MKIKKILNFSKLLAKGFTTNFSKEKSQILVIGTSEKAKSSTYYDEDSETYREDPLSNITVSKAISKFKKNESLDVSSIIGEENYFNLLRNMKNILTKQLKSSNRRLT